jgi:hypothetical protein
MQLNYKMQNNGKNCKTPAKRNITKALEAGQ